MTRPQENPRHEAHGGAAGHEREGFQRPAIALQQEHNSDGIQWHDRSGHDQGKEIDDYVAHGGTSDERHEGAAAHCDVK